MKDRAVTFEQVLRHLRKQNFAVLSTSDQAGTPYSAGVNYGVGGSDGELTLFVMTRRHLRKARNIAQNSDVSLVVPLPRRILWFLPPATIQLQGHAELLEWTDGEGTDAFRRFWVGRRILTSYVQSRWRGDTRICFVKITPERVINTYMVGSRIWQLRNRMEAGAAKVVIPE